MNKAELFAFIRHLLVTSKLIIITNGSEVVCIPPQDTSHLAPSNHEEADTRIILHMAAAINKGFKKIFLHCYVGTCHRNTSAVGESHAGHFLPRVFITSMVLA